MRRERAPGDAHWVRREPPAVVCMLGLTILTAGVVSVASGCQRSREVHPTTISGRIVAPPAGAIVPCEIEINSLTSPFYAPVVLKAMVGEEFTHAMNVVEPIDKVYVAVRCRGYEALVSKPFDLRPGHDVDLQKLLVSKAYEDGG